MLVWVMLELREGYGPGEPVLVGFGAGAIVGVKAGERGGSILLGAEPLGGRLVREEPREVLELVNRATAHAPAR